jgi:hypothetical protein
MWCRRMTLKKQLSRSDSSKNDDLERLMRELGCLDSYIADYPINDREARRHVGELISGAVQGHSRQYSTGLK